MEDSKWSSNNESQSVDTDSGLSQDDSSSDDDRGDSSESGGKLPEGGKRRKLRKHKQKMLLESVTETEDMNDSGQPDKSSCPDYFGVKSYLHHFYEAVTIKNPDLYEDLSKEDYYYLIKPRRRRCTSVWWKIGVFLGVMLLILGIVGILIGYLVPKHQVHVGYLKDDLIINRTALTFNYNLDVCKLVGLIIFCIGGSVLALSLLFPSFLMHYCEEDSTASEPFKIHTGHDIPPDSPIDKKIPATEKLKNIQPKRESGQAVVATKNGMFTVP